MENNKSFIIENNIEEDLDNEEDFEIAGVYSFGSSHDSCWKKQ